MVELLSLVMYMVNNPSWFKNMPPILGGNEFNDLLFFGSCPAVPLTRASAFPAHVEKQMFHWL